MKSEILSPEVERGLNLLGMLGIVGVFVGAFIYQFWFRELPCTLCLLQRVAMLGVAIGAAMNVMIGPKTRHYGVCLVSATFGLSVSIRQSLLHMNPYFDKKIGQPTLEATTNPPFGQEVLGLNLYVWGVIIFMTTFLAIGIVQLLRKTSTEPKDEPLWFGRISSIGVGMLVVVLVAQLITVFMECGLGDCPNDGSWNWWILRS
ncbi:MAG: disulfide bond formation protein B [Hyphomicrobiaceae bacterium]